jgi:hypothetical protein
MRDPEDFCVSDEYSTSEWQYQRAKDLRRSWQPECVAEVRRSIERAVAA